MRRSCLAVLPLTALALAGCGGGQATTTAAAALSPAASVQAASAATSAAGTARISLEVKSAVAGRSIDITGTGSFRLDGSQGSFDVSLDPGNGHRLTVTEQTVGGLLYLKAPPLGDNFYSLKTTALIGTSLGQGTDPTIGLSMLRGTDNDVTVVGAQKVRGTDTTHYKGTYRLRQATTRAGGAFAQAFASQLASNGDTPVPFEAFVGADGRLRRLVQVVTMTTAGQQVTSTSTTEFYDFGTPVQVTAPPAGKVKDGSSLLKGLSG